MDAKRFFRIGFAGTLSLAWVLSEAGLGSAADPSIMPQTPQPLSPRAQTVSVMAEAAPAPQAAPAPTAVTVVEGDPKPADPPKEEKPFWTKVPPVTPLPRVGMFPILPTGPGYYSAWDVITGNYRAKPPPNPYGPPFSASPGTFFNNDFRYLDDPSNKEFDYMDPFKRIHPNDNWLLSFGGEERLQVKNENDSRLSGKDNNYQLFRSRLYGDLWYRDVFRIYVEGIDARTTSQDLAPLPIDQNYFDFLNLFAEGKIGEFDGHNAYVRVGRQELLFGSQRLVSPLDWVNTRRTFQGVDAYYHGEKYDIDAFWTRPVHINPTKLDSWDHTKQFAGLWQTYRPKKGDSIDLYYLYLDDSNKVAATLPGQFGSREGQRVNTLGSRYAGQSPTNILWDFEGMYEFGSYANQALSAGAATAGLGYYFADVPMDPAFWIYYDWASGSSHPGSGSSASTFNQLFPFGHYYFGFLDQVGRQNIHDFNMQGSFWLTKWIYSGIQFHTFNLDSAKDALYNAAGVPIRRDPTGKAGTFVGNEIDYYTNFHLSRHQDILIGWSQLYAGGFIKKTGSARNAELFYFQYSYKW